MNIIYTIGNTKLETIRIVAQNLKKVLKNENVDKVVVFNTTESYVNTYEQMKCYHEYLGEFIEESLVIKDRNHIDPSFFTKVFSYPGKKIVDLTNGPKDITSTLYLVASLCEVKEIYYLSFNRNKNISEYVRLHKYGGIDSLSKISYFDLVYYFDELDKLFSDKRKSSYEVNDDQKNVFNRMEEMLQKGIVDFFNTENYTNVVYNITYPFERLNVKLFEYLKNDKECVSFAKKNNIIFFQDRDKIGVISFFLREYSQKGNNSEILALCTLPGLLTGLRVYRNLASHACMSKHKFTINEARTVINMMIEALKCSKSNKDFWEILGR